MAKKSVKLPDTWQQNLKSFSMSMGFRMQLSRPMLEFLCATADGVRWDRASYGDLRYPDNWKASGEALEKRGLVVFIDDEKERQKISEANLKVSGWEGELTYWKLTPAGELVVELLKLTGLFIEADNKHFKKPRSA